MMLKSGFISGKRFDDAFSANQTKYLPLWHAGARNGMSPYCSLQNPIRVGLGPYLGGIDCDSLLRKKKLWLGNWQKRSITLLSDDLNVYQR